MTPEPFYFDYQIGQAVAIRPLDVHAGIVTQRCDRGAGQHEYQVVFWINSKREVEWLMTSELAPNPNR